MKFKQKLFSIACALVLCAALFTGCSAGSTVDTVLEVNPDLSGCRKMDILLAGSVVEEYFSGSIDDLNAQMAQTCPSAMTWSYTPTEDGGAYHMEISFTSPEDYRQKV